jgi:hypothetical protein
VSTLVLLMRTIWAQANGTLTDTPCAYFSYWKRRYCVRKALAYVCSSLIGLSVKQDGSERLPTSNTGFL